MRALEMYEACVLDYCAFYDDAKLRDDIVCQGIEGYAEQCLEMGISVRWRTKDVCRMLDSFILKNRFLQCIMNYEILTFISLNSLF